VIGVSVPVAWSLTTCSIVFLNELAALLQMHSPNVFSAENNEHRGWENMGAICCFAA
jgi:hypothetical protein